jgi:hypothetical protein
VCRLMMISRCDIQSVCNALLTLHAWLFLFNCISASVKNGIPDFCKVTYSHIS